MDYMTAVSFTCARAMEFLVDTVTNDTDPKLIYECQWDNAFTTGSSGENVTLPDCICKSCPGHPLTLDRRPVVNTRNAIFKHPGHELGTS